jgi:hypothetical protein
MKPAKAQSNVQGERQLVAEWLATLPASWPTKTHLFVGEQTMIYGGVPLTPREQRAFAAWSDWCDARVVTPSEIWIVEGKLIATGGAYGQVLDYVNQYPSCADYLLWKPRAIVPVIVCQASRPRTAALFLNQGVRTIVFAPTFQLSESLAKLFPAQQIIKPGVGEPLPREPIAPQVLGEHPATEGPGG